MSRTLHPRHGIHDPSESTPARAPGSLRRTSSIDLLRPDGLEGDLVLVGCGRDLETGLDGGTRVLGEAAVEARIEYLAGRKVVSLRTEPEEHGTSGLVGVGASAGFRAAVDRSLPEHRDARSLLYLLLDDLPVATLVSGYAIGAGGVKHAPGPKHFLPKADLCAGWRTGGTLLVGIERDAQAPVVTGPVAPSLARHGDALAWHPLPPLPPHAMRRHRRLDLVRADKDTIVADALFRDSHVSADGLETIVHEYTVEAAIAADTLEIRAIDARPRALPWVECNSAVASAERLRGRALAGLRPHVRAEFTGTPTCTHLNDTFRSLEDIVGLVGSLGSG